MTDRMDVTASETKPNTSIENVRESISGSDLVRRVQALITQAELRLASRRQQLVDDMRDADPRTRSELTHAAEALDRARVQASEPVRQLIGRVLCELLTPLGIPIQCVHTNSIAAGNGKRKTPLDEDIVTAVRDAGPDGATTTHVAEKLSLSVKAIRRACDRMVEQKTLKHNGKPRQESRYLIP